MHACYILMVKDWTNPIYTLLVPAAFQRWQRAPGAVQRTAQHFIFMDGYRFAIERIGFKHIPHAHNWLSALLLAKKGKPIR